MDEARLVCAYMEGAGRKGDFIVHFGGKMSPGFDPDRDLDRVGVANQTTMLSGESLAIAAAIRESFGKRYGTASQDQHFRTFDTICSATQDRQHALLNLIPHPLHLMALIAASHTPLNHP